MKKTLIVAAALALALVAGTTFAGRGMMGGNGCAHCPRAMNAPGHGMMGPGMAGGMMGPMMGPMGPRYNSLSAEDKAKVDSFFKETAKLRRDMQTTRAEYQALMRSENPDPKRAGELAGKLFDLRTAMMTKADEAGIRSLMGPPAGQAMGPRAGMGGRGMNRARAAAPGPGMMAQGHPCPLTQDQADQQNAATPAAQ